MSNFNHLEIEEKIGYKFSNIELLHQAFVSPSISAASNNQKQNYQVLEFIGDAVLGLAVVKNITSDLSCIDNNGQFVSKTTVAKLNNLKQKNVKNETLEHCARVLTLNKFIEKNSSFSSVDHKNKKGDLIEAILGAVALDCEWNLEIICNVVKNILKFQTSYVNFCEKLENLCRQKKLFLPTYSFHKLSKKTKENDLSFIECFVSVPNAPKIFKAEHTDRLEAKNLACKEAFAYLSELEKQQIFSLKNPISELNQFCQQNNLSIPVYSFQEIIQNKKQSWKCDVSINECELIFSSTEKSKKAAKMIAATTLFCHLTGEDEKIKENFCIDDENVIRGQGLLKLILSKYSK